MKLKMFFYALLALLITLNINAQIKVDEATNAYIKKYRHLAAKHMKESKIPASIKMAQGILESNIGKSRLAVLANNHFGIKCYDGWKGSSISHDDDKKQECFKKYKSVEASYDDHTKFLKRSRYLALYNLNPDDYKGWAKGLQNAGYATDKSYATKLINIIEKYQLYEIDRQILKKNNKLNLSSSDFNLPDKPSKKNNKSNVGASDSNNEIYINNGVHCIIARNNQSLMNIANDFNIKPDKLYAYNDAYENMQIKKGDIIYIKEKKKRAEKPNFYYVVKSGDTLHSISQKFGVKVKSLYSLNGFKKDMQLKVGDKIKLR